MLRLIIDVGTTHIKYQLYEELTIVTSRMDRVTTYRGEFGKVYQNPEEMMLQIKRSIQRITTLYPSINAIVFSTAMHSIMPVFKEKRDEEMFIWLDTQGQEFITGFKEREEAHTFYQKTGTPIHEMSPFAKIGAYKKRAWFKDVTRWIGMKEYIMERLTGECVLDYSMASATGLFNLTTLSWDEDVLNYLGIEAHQLGRLVDTDYHTTLLPEQALALGLTEEVQVYVGASDGCLASLAGYMTNGTTNTLTIGTSGSVRKISKNIQLDSEGETFCYYLQKDMWVIGAASNNGGQVLEWLDTIFYGEQQIYQALDGVLQKSPIGSRGVRFYPYLTGERAPIWDSHCKGSFEGLMMSQGKEDLVRAALEGILFNLLIIAKKIDMDTKDLSISGGFFKDPLLATMAADVFGRHCLQSLCLEPGFGALCLINQGQPSLGVSDVERLFFNEDNHHFYNIAFQDFCKKINR